MSVDRPVVKLDIGLLKDILHIYTTNSMVSTAVSRFKMYILRSGINIKVSGTKTFSFDTSTGEDKQLFDQELYPAIAKMIEEWIVYGFTCVSIAPSTIIEGAYTLVVLPWDFITVTMQYNEHFQMKYKVGLRNAANISPETKRLIELAQFLCVIPPNDEGMSMSSIALCLEELRQYKKLWQDFLTVSHHRGRPVPMFSQSADAFGVLAAGTSDRRVTQTIANSAAVSAGLGSESMSRVFHTSEERRNQATREALHEAKARRQEMSSSSSSSSAVEDKLKYGDPLADIYVEPAGQRLDAALRYESPAELYNMCVRIEQKFQEALGLPKDDQIHRTAVGVEMYLNLLNMSIVAFCKKAQYLLTRPLSMLFNGKIVASIIGEDTEKSFKKKENDSAKDDDSASDDDEELDNERLRETVNSVISNTTVVVEFSTNPITTVDHLTTAYHEDVIPYEQYVEQMLEYMNIQPWSTSKGTYYSKRQADAQAQTQRLTRQRTD